MPGLKGLGNGSGPQFSAWLFPMEYASPATSVSSSTWLTGKTVGRFTIHERLGKGGMGEVYRAEDTRLKRTVALKRLTPLLRSDPLYRRRFQLEAERASRFADPHVAAIYDVIDEQDETLLVMEYVEGQTLRQRLRQSISLEDFLRIAIECAEALVAADRVGIVHCDIKPENIMLSSSGSVKILDFGVAKFLPRSDQSSTVDRSGTIGGTPAYMAPEVLLEKSADGRSDIFSLGLVLYEALAGHHPFLSDSYVATTHRILHEKAAPIRVFNRRIPEELDRIVAQAMAKEPSDRYPSAHDLLDDLRAVQAGVTPSKLLPVPVLQQAKRFWSPIFAILVLLLIGASYGIYRWTHPHPTFRERGWALIADFESSGEDPVPDKGVREGLTIALQQSPYVNVYPRTRLYEALQRMRRGNVGRIDETLGREICRRENLQVLLAGSIEHLGRTFQMTVRAVDPDSGNLLFAEQQQFNSKDQFFDEVDKLARDVRQHLGESLARIEKTSQPLAKVTTNSLEALQLYSQASDLVARGTVEPVASLLQGALQLDNNFAMAHLLLGDVYEVVGNPREELKHLQAAYDLRNGVTDRERRLIEGNFYSARGQYEKQVESLKILVSLYPDDVQAHQDLALAYRNIGDVPRGIEQLREVVRLNRFSAPGYLDLILFLSRNNENDEAIATYKGAVDRGLETPVFHWGLGLALLGQGNAGAARDQFVRVREAGGAYQSIGRIYVARSYIYEGKFAAAIEQLNANVIADRASKNTSPELVDHYLLASIYLTQRKSDMARSELKLILAPSKDNMAQSGDLLRVGTLYARMGKIESAKIALHRLNTARSRQPTSFNNAAFHVVAGEISMAEGRLAEAAKSLALSNQEYPMVLTHESLARLYEAQKDWPRAAAEWHLVLNSRGEILHDHSPADWTLAHLALARAYSKNKDYTMADDYYRRFLELWTNSDLLAVKQQAIYERQQLKRSVGSGRAQAPHHYGVNEEEHNGRISPS